MSAVEIALPRLKIAEGFRATKYLDTVGKGTIGYGFCFDEGISEFAAAALLAAQAQERHQALMKLPWYVALNAARQSVCLDISFNAGIAGLLNFERMITALTMGNWVVAAAECSVKDPELATRYENLAQILLTGVA